MKIEWKLLSLSMFASGIFIWICALIVSVLFIQPLLDSWRCLPLIISENTSVTFTGSKLPTIPLWALLLIALGLWGSLTVCSYTFIPYLNRNKKEEKASEVR
jgi:hypothetical protein